jgi:Bardet-Biedl syndrome 2 protein
MDLIDVDDDGARELVTASDDGMLRAFKHEEMLFEAAEQGKVRHVSRVRQDTFAYALENGQIGVYQKRSRLWKIRHRQKVTALLGIDFNNDGKCQVVLGFENGRLEVREDTAGTIIFKKTFASAISKLLYADFRLQNSMQVICCTSDGEGTRDVSVAVKGFSIVAQSKMDKSTVSVSHTDAISDLNREKQSLINELSMLAGEMLTTKASSIQQIPKDIKATCKLEVDFKRVPVHTDQQPSRRS